MMNDGPVQTQFEESSARRAVYLQSAAKKWAGKHEKVRILVVDDEAAVCEILTEVLLANGYPTDTTFTFSEALKRMKQVRYNLMITDIRLPDRSGIELLEWVEKISPETAVIVITGFPETETAIRALNHGAFSYLIKPFSNRDLLNVVDKALKRQGTSLRRAQLLERLRRKSEKFRRLCFTDKLTGLYNRTYLEEILAREEMRVQRYKRPVAIVMVDINDLKQINDRFGHLMGDRVIKEAATLLRTHCRASDIAARYGGDEFVIFLPETSKEGAMVLVNSLRRAVRNWNLSNTIHKGLPLNLAFGCASVENGGTLTDALKEADARMYRDKMGQKALSSHQLMEMAISPPASFLSIRES